jgi:hypothetical protein
LPQAPLLPERWLRPWRAKIGPIVGVWAAFATAVVVGMQFKPYGASIALLALSTAIIARLLHRTRKHNKQIGEAALAQMSGKLEHADALLVDLAKSAAGAQTSASAQYQLALVALARGEIDRALALFQAAYNGKGMRMVQPIVHQTTPFFIAFIYAVVGDHFAARAWCAHAKKHRTFDHLQFDIAIDAILLAREHEPVRASQMLEEKWLIIEPAYSAGLTRALRVVRALLVHEAGERERATRLAESAKPFVRNEYAWLGERWPEMQSFLADNQLV